ncbi:DUF2537 domain-containing protein [Hoyosella sp. YIM 151337]|uniref:DUF2537 domain-containing protein n=1 Tax=Hoyosella sp. YIM 151337 TaxID=2992742 RepID=UPI002235463C|nr:DUF2537 domain-containing protein [Hoyosella sp. YIM 151337]MCW4356007.1 DUF2537 domain-containing protein [Hoyosella sp. YIM 151337]
MAEREDRTETWVLGLVFAGSVALIVGVIVAAAGSGLVAIHPLLALVLNVTVAIGFAQPLWEWRKRPTLRFAALGIAMGALFAWGFLIVGVFSGSL